jgi:hypothetical protein
MKKHPTVADTCVSCGGVFVLGLELEELFVNKVIRPMSPILHGFECIFS